jgi:hypothetical protein
MIGTSETTRSSHYLTDAVGATKASKGIMDAVSSLAVIAQIAATLIGFTGVLFAIGRFSAGGLSSPEHNAFVNVLLPSVLALFLALAPMIVSSGVQPSQVFWRVFNGILVVVHVPSFANAARAAFRGELPEPIRLQRSMVAVGFSTIVASAVAALGFAGDYASLLYLAVVSWFLIVSVVEFVLLVLSHTRA